MDVGASVLSFSISLFLSQLERILEKEREREREREKEREREECVCVGGGGGDLIRI